MYNILFPTDLSETSHKALSYTTNFANDIGAQITVMNIFQASYSHRRPIIEEGTTRRQILKKLKTFVKSGAGREFNQFHFLVQEGHPLKNLISASRHRKYDLLVMGRSRSYDWLNRVLGSRTYIVSSKAHTPVLIVPPEFEYKPIKNILVVCNSYQAFKVQVDGILDEIKGPSNPMLHFIYLSNSKVDEDLYSEGIQTNTSINQKSGLSTISLRDEIKHHIRQFNIDLLVVNLKYRNLLQRLFKPNFGFDLILDNTIPTLVINNRRKHWKSIPSKLQLSMLKKAS